PIPPRGSADLFETTTTAFAPSIPFLPLSRGASSVEAQPSAAAAGGPPCWLGVAHRSLKAGRRRLTFPCHARSRSPESSSGCRSPSTFAPPAERRSSVAGAPARPGQCPALAGAPVTATTGSAGSGLLNPARPLPAGGHPRTEAVQAAVTGTALDTAPGVGRR